MHSAIFASQLNLLASFLHLFTQVEIGTKKIDRLHLLT